MKKTYIEPEFELVNIRLIADVLGPSTYDPSEEVVPSEFAPTDDPFE